MVKCNRVPFIGVFFSLAPFSSSRSPFIAVMWQLTRVKENHRRVSGASLRCAIFVLPARNAGRWGRQSDGNESAGKRLGASCRVRSSPFRLVFPSNFLFSFTSIFSYGLDWLELTSFTWFHCVLLLLLIVHFDKELELKHDLLAKKFSFFENVTEQ